MGFGFGWVYQDVTYVGRFVDIWAGGCARWTTRELGGGGWRRRVDRSWRCMATGSGGEEKEYLDVKARATPLPASQHSSLGGWRRPRPLAD